MDSNNDKMVIKELKNKILLKDEMINALKIKIKELEEYKQCQNRTCDHKEKLSRIEADLELNIVDSKIKIVDLVDQINELQYRSERLESIILSTPGKFTKLIDDIDRKKNLTTSETHKIRKSLLVMRSLSTKLMGNIPKKGHEIVFSDKKNNNVDPLFESILVKFQEFTNILIDSDINRVSNNFNLLCIAIEYCLEVVNEFVNKSKMVQQKVCYIRSSDTNNLVNIMACQEDYEALKIFQRLLEIKDDGMAAQSIKLKKTDEVYHPFVNKLIYVVFVEKRKENKILIRFTNTTFKHGDPPRINLYLNRPKVLILVQNRLSEIFRLFNQIWKYKNSPTKQSPPQISIIKAYNLNENISSTIFIENLVPISKINSTKLTDSAREVITGSCAATLIGFFVLGIPMNPTEIFFDKFGKIYVKRFNVILSKIINEEGKKDFKWINEEKIIVPQHLITFFKSTGLAELRALSIGSYANLRRFSKTIKRFVIMSLNDLFDKNYIKNYLEKRFFNELPFTIAIRKINEMIKRGSENYINILDDL